MARGIAANEGIVSQASTRAFDENADRIGLGKSERAKERGSFVWDAKRGALVRPWEVEQDTTALARDAAVSVGRFYEGVPSPRGDGVVFQSRAQHREYMRRHNLTTTDDYDRPGGAWDKAEAKRAQGMSTPEQRKDRQERLGRRLYEVSKLPQKTYERQVREAAERRANRKASDPTE